MSETIRNILVPLDLSPASDTICRYAVEVARCFRARVTVLNVVEGMAEFAELNLPHIPYEDLEGELDQRARERLEAYAKEHLQPVADKELLVSHGDPDEVVLRTATERNVDLIVMGTHGRKGLERAIFGSTAERVLRGTRVPVFAVPVPE